MSFRHLVPATALLALLAGCTSPDDPGPTAPPPNEPTVGGQPPAPPGPDLDRARHERLAARVARALRDPAFRTTIAREVANSPFAEGKIHLQSFLDRENGVELRRLARLSGETDEAVRRDLDAGGAIEVYFPVPAHRTAWNGGTDLIVATAETDRDAPVGFDLLGRRRILDQATPPAQPVLMVSRAETDFSLRPRGIDGCLVDCGGGGGGGGSVGAPPAPQGLFLTQTRFTGTFESWFKGSPEFEVHVLGQAGTTGALTTYQCAGEYAGGPYTFDQNGTTWSGSVMLMSQAQLDQYHQQHPGQNLRVFVVEDDDTACEIKVDSTRTANLFKAIKLVYGELTGGKDSVGTVAKVFKRAPILLNLISAAASWFKTNDDPVGNAVEDATAAGTFFVGANWVIRGEQSATNGAVRLEMR